ncbi:MAG: hypothetical protein E6G50_14925 [Actinobacteria bacterium]|nr:MAG: hypothetical protein E6G50_14925 [Actinomycetota bacterium]
MPRDPSQHQATRARDAGLARLQRLTGAAIAGAVVLSGVFAGIAASSTHPRKVMRRGRAREAVQKAGPIPALPPTRAPSLAATPAPAPPPAPPAAAPTSSPPVVVSGGS